VVSPVSRDVPVCNGKCHKGAADPACPLHGKGGKGFTVARSWPEADDWIRYGWSPR